MKPVQSLFSLVFRRPRYSRLAASPLTARMSRMPSRSFSLRIFEQKRDCSQSNVRLAFATFFYHYAETSDTSRSTTVPPKLKNKKTVKTQTQDQMPFFALWLYIENNRKFDHPSLLAFSAVFMFSFAYVSACMFFRALFSACIIFPRFQPTWSWPKFTLKLLHCGFYAFVATGKLGIKKKKNHLLREVYLRELFLVFGSCFLRVFLSLT